MQQTGYKQLLTVSEVAMVFGISDRTVRRMINNGKLNAVEEKGVRGRGGVAYMVPVEALPEEMKVNWAKLVRAGKLSGDLNALPTQQTNEHHVHLEKSEQIPAQQKKKRNNTDSYIDVATSEAEQKKKAFEESGRPKSLEECSAVQREQIVFWKEIINDWQRQRSEAKEEQGIPLVEFDDIYITRLETEKGIEISIGNLHRKHKLYKQLGDVGLADMRGVKNSGRTVIHKEAWGQFDWVYFDQSQRNLKHCYDLTWDWAEEHHPELLPLPSYSTFERMVKKVPHAYTMYLRHGIKKYENAAMPYITRTYEDMESNDIWVGDNHTLDILSTQDGTQTVHRLYLTMFVDARSRMPTGWNICLTPNSESTILAFRHGCMRCGIPKAVYVDNGREFLVSDFGGRGHRKKAKAKHPLPPTILNNLGVVMMNALPENAKAKIIERTFREFCERFSKNFESYIGNNPVNRPERMKKNVKAEELVLDSEVIRIINLFIEGIYSMTAQNGTGMNGEYPMKVFEDNLKEKRVASEDELNLMMLRTSRMQKVGKNGVRLDFYGKKLFYWNDDFLYGWCDKHVYVRFDTKDLRTVRAYDEQDKFIGVIPCREDLVMGYDASKDDIQTGQQAIRGYTKLVKSKFVGRSGVDALPLLISKAERNRRELDTSGAVVKMTRHNEKAYMPKAVGHDTDDEMPLSFMLQNARKNKGLDSE